MRARLLPISKRFRYSIGLSKRRVRDRRWAIRKLGRCRIFVQLRFLPHIAEAQQRIKTSNLLSENASELAHGQAWTVQTIIRSAMALDHIPPLSAGSQASVTPCHDDASQADQDEGLVIPCDGGASALSEQGTKNVYRWHAVYFKNGREGGAGACAFEKGW